MRLTILGGSAASPNAGAGCSGYLVQTPGATLVLDPGPGTLPELRRYADYRTLDAVVVSHLHLDHCLDLLALQVSLAYNPISAPGPVPIWLPPGGVSWLSGVWAAIGDYDEEPGFFLRTIAAHEIDPGRPLQLGDADIRFAPSSHNIPCWAMRLAQRGTRSASDLGYTADTGPSANLAEFFAGVRVLLAEATLLEPAARPAAQRGSLTAREAGLLAAAAGAQVLVLTHYWEERGLEPVRHQAEEAFAGRIELARPGLIVDVSS